MRCPRRRFRLACVALGLVAAMAPVRAGAAGDSNEPWMTGTLYGSLAAQAGAYGDIYERTGTGAGFELELHVPDDPGPWSTFLDFEDVAFALRPTGHVIHGTADTLFGGSTGRLSLGKCGLRRYWGESRRWRFFGEGGLGSGIAKSNYTTGRDYQSPGERESFVFDAFAGLGLRRYFTKRLDGSLGLRVDGLSSIGGTSGVFASLRAGLSMKFGSM